LNGRLMGTKNLGGIAAGNNTFDLNIRNLTNGFYIVAMQTEQGVVTQKMTVQR